MNGEWIIVHPTDCFTMFPVYECSVCKNLCHGDDPDLVCIYCGANNTVNTKQYIDRPIFDSNEKYSTNHTSISTNEYVDRDFKIDLNISK